jgi:cell division transport system permease protein
MIAARFAARVAARSRVLPLGGAGELRLLVWAFALMAYVAGLGAAGLLVLGRSEAGWRRAAEAAMTLEVPAEVSSARVKTAMALLKQTHGIAAVRLLPAAETARLLEPWLGPDAQLDGLPLPRLIDLRASPDSEIDFAALRQRLAAVVPQAKLDGNRDWLAGLRRLAAPLRLVLAACVAAGLAGMAPAALYAAGSAAAADRELIEATHLLGADDRDLARPFVLRALRLGLAGGAIGGLAVAATLAALGRAAAVLPPMPPVGLGIADWRSWAIVAAVALAAGLVAALAAEAGMRRRLAELP